jgi:hypothetical protein
MGGWITAGIVFLLGFLICNLVFFRENHVPVPVRIIVPILFPLFLAGYALLIGYVYGDARRRGMRYVMWTLLAIFLQRHRHHSLFHSARAANGVLFALRGGVQPSHAFCPRCGAGVQPACPGCHRPIQPGWTHCAWCGNQL